MQQLLYITLAVTAVNIFFILLIFLKQFTDHAFNRRNQKYINERLGEFAHQAQESEQNLRENLLINISKLQQALLERLGQARVEYNQQAAELKEQLQQAFANHRARFDERQLEALKILQDTLQKGVQENRTQVKEALTEYANQLKLNV